MRSVQWSELKKTFRFRLAVMHVLLVSMALTVTFVVALSLVRATLSGFAKEEMRIALHTAEIAYLGKQEKETGQLPERLMERVEKQFPLIHIGMVEKESQPNGVLYEIIATLDNEWLEILLDPDGEMWLADRKPLQEVFVAMKDAILSDGRDDIVLFLCAPDGTFRMGDRPRENGGLVSRVLGRLDGIKIVRRGEDMYGGLLLFDGNRLYGVKEMEAMEQITLWAVVFFAVLIVVFIPVMGWIGFLISRKAMSGVRRVSAAAHRVQSGNFKERVSSASEGTEIDELVMAFNAMVSQIDLLMRELRDVTANIAHDLKTPVSRIRGLLESSGWKEVDAQEQEQLISSAIEECDRIMPLIDSILELSRAEAGMLVLQNEPFDLSAEVCSACEMFSTVAEDREITLRCSVPERPVMMVGDCGRMQRVIANLIDNALKYTSENGNVSVLLETSATRAMLTVRDNGPGIPRSELENVFKRFYRLDPSRRTPGHGMGLSMVRAFVLAFGGAVSIDSDTGKGCCVTVMLPLNAG